MAGSGRVSLALYTVVRAVVVAWCRVWFRATVEGAEHVPTSGAYVLAPVHRSNVDTPLAACITRQRLRYMGKDTMWKVRAAGWFFSAMGGFPVTRGTADREALKRCIEVLEGGEPLVIFPEGERKSGPLVQPLFDGAAYVATKCQVPIVPVGIGGSERAMPKGASWIRPTKVHIVVGRPLVPETAEGGRAPRRAVAALSDDLHRSLQALFDAAQVRAGA